MLLFGLFGVFFCNHTALLSPVCLAVMSIACTEVGRQDGPNGARKAPISGHVDGFIGQHRRRVRAFPHQTYVFLQGEVSYFSASKCFENNDADFETSLRWILETAAFDL